MISAYVREMKTIDPEKKDQLIEKISSISNEVDRTEAIEGIIFAISFLVALNDTGEYDDAINELAELGDLIRTMSI